MVESFVTLENNYILPCVCYGTDIVSEDFFGDSLFEQTVGRSKKLLKSVLRKDLNRYRKEKGIIKCTDAAIKNGCTFFDTSRAYEGSERMLRHSLKDYNREDYYICTKLRNYDQLHHKSAEECLMDSMERLGVSYVDLYLLHWPVSDSYLSYWKQLEELYEKGFVKAIGVSNCKIHHLEEIKKIAKYIPMVNEVELHPLLTEVELRQYCQNSKIQIMAYTSTARMDFRLKRSKRLETICKKYNKSISQVILRWHIQNGVIPIFNTSSVDHFKNNLNIFDFRLSDEDMLTIDGLNINARTRYDSDNCEWDRL